MSKLIIAGSRSIDDYDFLKQCVWDLDLEITEVVCGMCKSGVDMLGYRYAKENNIPIKEFSADWDSHGKAAGIIRNRQMAEYADALLAIWDLKSKGTYNMIETMKNKNKYVEVVVYEHKDSI